MKKIKILGIYSISWIVCFIFSFLIYHFPKIKNDTPEKVFQVFALISSIFFYIFTSIFVHKKLKKMSVAISTKMLTFYLTVLVLIFFISTLFLALRNFSPTIL